MWSLIRKDLGEFVTTLKDDAAGTIKSAMAHGEGGEDEYESSVRSWFVRREDVGRSLSLRVPVYVPPPLPAVTANAFVLVRPSESCFRSRWVVLVGIPCFQISSAVHFANHERTLSATAVHTTHFSARTHEVRL